MGFIPGVKAFAAAVLGGIGNIRGAMLGGLLLGVVEATVPTAPWYKPGWIGIEWTDVVAFLVLVAGPGRPAHRHPRRASGACGMKRRSVEAEARIDNVKRLVACLAGGFVLALMVGTQEGTQQDFGYAFRESVAVPRIFIFLGHRGAALPRHHLRPSVEALPDQAGPAPPRRRRADGRGLVHAAEVDRQPADQHRQVPATGRRRRPTPAPRHARSPVLRLRVLADGLGAADHRDGARRCRDDPAQRSRSSYAAAVLAVRPRDLGGVRLGDGQQVPALPEPRHRRCRGDARLLHHRGRLAGLGAQPGRGGRHRRLHRQGAGLAPGHARWSVLGVVVGCVGVFNAAWFSPGDRNATLSTTASMFGATSLNGLSRSLPRLARASCCSSSRSCVAAAASYLRHQRAGRTPRSCSASSRPCSRWWSCTTSPRLGAKQGFDGANGAWDNLGTGAWMTCAALSLFAGAGYLVVKDLPRRGQGRPTWFRHPRQRHRPVRAARWPPRPCSS